MNNADFDRIIAQEQNTLNSILDQGDKLIPEFKRVTTSYVRELSINVMKSYYKHKPELVSSLGNEKLEEIKQEFTGILASLPDQTSQRLADTQIWLHRVKIPDHAISDMSYSYQFEKRSNRAMDNAIRELIGLVGALLMKYGFVEAGKDFTWKMAPDGSPLYANDLPTRGMEHYMALNKLMEQYKDLLIEYVFAFQNLRKAEQARDSD